MSDPDDFWFVKERLRSGPRYHLDQPPHRIKLNQNENPHELPGELKIEVTRRFLDQPWGRYPPFVPDDLHGALGRHYGFDKDWVLAGNGSNEVLYALMAALLDPGDAVVCPVPTFTLYELLARVFGARFVAVDVPPPFRFEPGAVIEEARRFRAKLVILCSPNNPTGAAVSLEALREILAGTEGLVLLDEAYVEFADLCFTSEVLHNRRLVVLRTFSKALSMAGLRVGCAIGHPDLMGMVSRCKLPYALNAFSVTAVQTVLEHPGAFAPAIESLRRQRQVLHDGLARLPGVTPWPSQANFVLARFPGRAREIWKSLADAGLLVRDVSHYPHLTDHLRVTVGTAGETSALLGALAAVAAGGPA